ncbi:competence damage-inducible protein A [Devosia pacifica]|uniref:Competence damage-inducible protein A n=1 Tax=Devosia pacifica TaxID=1335967 RepID=A0A918VP21_9HYPH|nr:CinA family protein [Devosia pacifica]GHA11779.1 competence damage-inducible protein A [Devosia pacifica]
MAKAGEDRAKAIIDNLANRQMTIATAESCTGGLLAVALTDVPGASAAYYGSYITYANSAKSKMIRVPARLIRDYGAVSNQVARAMADGARNAARVDFAVSVTGVAGPDGGTDKKPVGLVYVAVSSELATVVIEHKFGTLSRSEIRRKSVDAALELVWQVLTSSEGD